MKLTNPRFDQLAAVLLLPVAFRRVREVHQCDSDRNDSDQNDSDHLGSDQLNFHQHDFHQHDLQQNDLQQNNLRHQQYQQQLDLNQRDLPQPDLHQRDSHPRFTLLSATLLLTVLLSILSGCGQSETAADRELARLTMREQAAQNQRIADTTHDLVSADAQARQELIESHSRLQETLQAERANLDQQQSQLHQLREDIERDRRQAPIIAEAIHIVGGIVVCLVPLLLAGYVLYSVNLAADEDGDRLVNEILIGELISESPTLLPRLERLTITDRRALESADPPEIEPPF